MATQIIEGNSAPDGFIEAAKGTFYLNTQSKSLFVKVKGSATSNKGWKAMNVKGFYESGEGSIEGNPEGKLLAPKYAVYLDNEAKVLYMQTVEAYPIIDTGWVSLNEGELYTQQGDPNLFNTNGHIGDLYIDIDANQVYVCSRIEDNIVIKDGVEVTEQIFYWDRLSLMEVDSNDVVLRLSELLTNSTSITSQYFNMFFNPEPMDIKLAQYDQDGILRNYIVPNRAKDCIALVGDGDPEGQVYAVRGKLYLDAMSGIPYIKTTNEAVAEGWTSLRRPNVQAPLEYDAYTNTLIPVMDFTPTEGSQNFVNSGTLYNELEDAKRGSTSRNFLVAEAEEINHAVSKQYVDTTLNSFLYYDSSRQALVINTSLNKDLYANDTVLGQAGTFYTPAFGVPYSTVFTFTNSVAEAQGLVTYIRSNTPCRLTVYSPLGASKLLEFTADITENACFNEEIIADGGIKKIQIHESSDYVGPSIATIKTIYKQLSFVQKEAL